MLRRISDRKMKSVSSAVIAIIFVNCFLHSVEMFSELQFWLDTDIRGKSAWGKSPLGLSKKCIPAAAATGAARAALV